MRVREGRRVEITRFGRNEWLDTHRMGISRVSPGGERPQIPTVVTCDTYCTCKCTHIVTYSSFLRFSLVVFLMEKCRGQVVGLIQGWKPAKWAGQKCGQMARESGTLTRVTEGVIRGS